MLSLKLPMPTEYLIPHKPVMKFVNRLEKYTEETAETHINVDQNIFLNGDDELEPVVLAEFVAQLRSAHLGYKTKLHNKPDTFGLLVGIKNFSIKDEIKRGQTLHIKARVENEIHPFCFTSGRIFRNGKLIASGTLRLWEQDAGVKELLLPEEHNPETAAIKQSEIKNHVSEEYILKSGPLQKQILDHIYEFNSSPGKKTCSAGLCFPPDFIGFKGHFPQLPVLPGVITLKAGKIITEFMLSRRIRVTGLDDVKFNNRILPGQWINLNCEMENDSPHHTVQVKVSFGPIVYSTFLLHVLEL
jgi:3-hydroxymyristoyl/3-hydroxydecanoyl-(acyl carrier protein) dehydratase